MSQDSFISRHVGPSADQLTEMLETIGVKSVDELIDQVVPATIRLKQPLDLPAEGMTEYEYADHIRALGRKNKIYSTLR